MALTKQDVLRMMAESESSLTEYIFIEMGLVSALEDLIHEECLIRVTRNDNFDEIRITDKGRAIAQQKADD